MPAEMAAMTSARSAGLICGQGPWSNASRAAATARSTSAGRGAGGVEVAGGGRGDLGDALFGVGRDHGELVGTRRVDPVTADEELVLVHLFSSDRVLEP